MLDLLRGNIYVAMDRVEQALKYMKRLVKNIPDRNIEAYYTIIALEVRDHKDYAEACRYLVMLRKNFSLVDGAAEMKLKNFLLPMSYKTFLSSPEYKAMAK
jgi:tetratricopeptide (TPR) repeat protein